jgi:cytochrome c
MNAAGVVAVALLSAGATLAAGAADDAALRRGQEIYSRCAGCHAIEFNRTGPQHCGLIGRHAGTAPGFSEYSKAMRASSIVWNAQTLDRFLQDPMKAVRGTAMGYAGVKDPQERADLIAWLQVATRPGQSCHLSQ